MSDTAVTGPKDHAAALDRIKDTMASDEIILSAKTQKLANQLKNLDGHFYSVGKYKAPDGTWKDKMEPDAFAVQTMSTLQQINTEVLSMTWESPDDLLNAAVTVRVRGWKGQKANPSIEKTVELRLSMKAITAKYVMDKLEPKKKWDDATRSRREMPAEWTEADVVLRDDGWVQPKSFKHQVAMRSFLVDQFSFLGRMAESKAERRINLKLLGFDWRDPDEINHESGETAAVSAAKPDIHADPGPVLAAIEQCKTEAEIDALTPTLTIETGRLSEDDRQKVFQKLKEQRETVRKSKPAEAPQVIEKATLVETSVMKDGTMEVGVTDVAYRKDAPEMPQEEFFGWLEGLAAQETPEGLKDLSEAFSAKPSSPAQKSEFDARLLMCSEEVQPKPKKSKSTSL